MLKRLYSGIFIVLWWCVDGWPRKCYLAHVCIIICDSVPQSHPPELIAIDDAIWWDGKCNGIEGQPCSMVLHVIYLCVRPITNPISAPNTTCAHNYCASVAALLSDDKVTRRDWVFGDYTRCCFRDKGVEGEAVARVLSMLELPIMFSIYMGCSGRRWGGCKWVEESIGVWGQCNSDDEQRRTCHVAG